MKRRHSDNEEKYFLNKLHKGNHKYGSCDDLLDLNNQYCFDYYNYQQQQQMMQQQQSFQNQSFEQQSFEQQSFEQQSFEQQSFEQQSFEQQRFEHQSFEQQSFEQQSFEQQSFQQQQQQLPPIPNELLMLYPPTVANTALNYNFGAGPIRVRQDLYFPQSPLQYSSQNMEIFMEPMPIDDTSLNSNFYDSNVPQFCRQYSSNRETPQRVEKRRQSI